MTDEEKLKGYLRRNDLKQQKSISSELAEKPKVVAPTRSPIAFYTRKMTGDIIAFMFAVFLITFLVLLYLNAKAPENTGVFILTLCIAGFSFFLVIAAAMFYRFRYINWINGKYYFLNGWNEFFELRSPSFWSKRMYTNLRITFKLKDSATDLHREALLTFIKKAIQKWNQRYARIDWASGYGTPKDLVSEGMSFYGDISRVELISVVRMLTADFIPLASLLGAHLEVVSIESHSAEKEYQTKKVSRNAYDRQSGFGK